MTSSTSSSDRDRGTLAHRAWLFAATTLMLGGLLAACELLVRSRQASPTATSLSVAELMSAMPAMRISGREIDNQMLVHNVAFFERHPAPAAVFAGYVGTSRSKELRPSLFGLPNTVVGAGNSYNEITYGLLAQAEILRLQFPNVKTVFIESSLLLRRPGRLIVEPDHAKYLPIIRSFSSLCDELPDQAACDAVFREVAATEAPENGTFRGGSSLLAHRSDLRLSNFFPTAQAAEVDGIPVLEDKWLSSLAYNGERSDVPRSSVPVEDQRARITNDNVKVQRLREIASNHPWDQLFDLIAVWGGEHGIDVVLFQPPVRSDLYEFQVQNGLALHVADLERVSEAHQVPFIDLNKPSLGYMDDWSLFSDEDHMGTCIGSGLLTLALTDGYREFKEHGVLRPTPSRDAVEERHRAKIESCGRG